MSAIDSDEQAEFRRFTYRISGGDVDNNFRVDSTSGWITTHARLDREQQETHTFTVVAIDSGSPPRTGKFFEIQIDLQTSPQVQIKCESFRKWFLGRERA